MHTDRAVLSDTSSFVHLRILKSSIDAKIAVINFHEFVDPTPPDRAVLSDTASFIHLRILNSSVDAKIAVLPHVAMVFCRRERNCAYGWGNVKRNFTSQSATDAKIAVHA
jgi:hypothetical protein